jgi:large subunit ribosomal protein L22
MNVNPEENIEPERLDIKEAFVNGGPIMKRFRAAAMGRVSPRHRPTSHVTIVVTDEK